MTQLEQALSFIGDIYDAALDPSLWPDVLKNISAFVGGPASALVSNDLAAEAGRSWGSCGDGPDCITTSISDHLAPADAGVRRRMDLLVPHVRRAVAVANIIELHRTEAEVLAGTVDTIAAGVFLVGADCMIVRANASGQAMLHTGDILRKVDRMLVAADVAAPRLLGDAVAAATSGDLAVGARGVAIPLASRQGERYVAHVLPLASSARRRAGLAGVAVAAVFAHKAAHDRPLPLEAIAEHFGLTPAELRVLVAVVEIGGVPQIAPVLGVSETTVKAHLRSLFIKTGAERQADLIKLVAGYASPLLA
jgi:DNA-binding CsgD family transcriptional regulator